MLQIYGTMGRFTVLLPAYFLWAFTASAQSFAAPEPYGGKQAVNWMLEQEQQFPSEALAAGVKGDVIVALKVMTDGTSRNVRVQVPLDPACDAEAVRLAKLIRWKPASVSSTPMDTDHSIAIPFNAKRYAKLQSKTEPCPPLGSTRTRDTSNTLYTDREADTLAAPRIPGGLRALPQYLVDNLKYPPEAFRLDIQGKVTIEFVVETSGNISNLRTLNFLGGGCDDEAMRLARSICWSPAVKDGELVRSVMKLDILFRLNPSLR
jgi:TonB family protein